MNCTDCLDRRTGKTPIDAWKSERTFAGQKLDVLSAVNDGDSLLCQQLAPLITSVDSCC